MIWRLPSRLVVVALAVRAVDEWWSYLPAGIVADLHRDLGLSYERAGWLIGLLYVGGLAGSPLDALADHVDRRLLVATGGVLLSSGLLAYALASSFVALAVASLVLGMASDLMVSPLEAALAETEGDRLDRLLGVQHAVSFGGDVVGPLLLGVGAATALGWRGVFAVTALAVLLFSLLAAAAVPARPAPSAVADDGAAGGRPGRWRELRAIATRRDVLLLCGLELLIGPLDEPLFAFVVARSASHVERAGTEQLLAVGVMVGGMVASTVVGRRGIGTHTARSGTITMLAGTAMTLAGPGMAVNVVAMTLVGIGMALLWAALHHQMLTVVPGRAGTVSALAGVAGAASGLIPAAIGAIADQAGFDAALAGFVVLAALVVVVGWRLGGRTGAALAPVGTADG